MTDNDNNNNKIEELASIAVTEEPDGLVPDPPELPGARLAARRRDLNLSLDQVSQKLKLSPRQIAAIEANDFAALAGMVTVKGFIRSYAKALEMDPDPLVKMVSDEASPSVDPVLRRPLPSSGFTGPRYATIGHHRKASSRLAGFGALIVIFLALLAFSGHRMGWLPLPLTMLVNATDKLPAATLIKTEESSAPGAATAVAAPAADQKAADNQSKNEASSSGSKSRSGAK